MPICFLISPIGEDGFEACKNAGLLRNLIVKPVLKPYGFTVLSRDYCSDTNLLDIDIIRAIQKSDLCIADISHFSEIVCYEISCREKTGKPLVLLKSKECKELPKELSTKKYVEYDLNSHDAIAATCMQLQRVVYSFIENGLTYNRSEFENPKVAKINRKYDKKGNESKRKTEENETTEIGRIKQEKRLVEEYRAALQQRNVTLAERAMIALSNNVERVKWLGTIVEPVATIGSLVAGDILIENIGYYYKQNKTIIDKIDYFGCLVSNLIKTGRVLENIELLEALNKAFDTVSEQHTPIEKSLVNNQMSKAYYSVYASTNNESWLEEAIQKLEEAIGFNKEEKYLHYNMAICLKTRNGFGDMKLALSHALRCVELSGDMKNADHIQMVCELLHEENDNRLMDYMDMLSQVCPAKADLLKSRWGSIDSKKPSNWP